MKKLGAGRAGNAEAGVEGTDRSQRLEPRIPPALPQNAELLESIQTKPCVKKPVYNTAEQREGEYGSR
jgi:hypothetical protein